MPITTYDYSGVQPITGNVSDLSTALAAYMDQKNQRLKQEGQGYENMYSRAKGARAEDYVESEIQRNKNLALMDALKVAHESQYGGAREELEQQKIQSEINRNNKIPEGRKDEITRLHEGKRAAQEAGDEELVKSIDRTIRKKQGTGLTGTSKTNQQGAEVANITSNYIQKLPIHYLGSGSNQRIFSDLAKLKATRNPEIENELGPRLAEAAAFQKLIPEYASVQFAKANQGKRPSVHERKEQEQAIKQGMPWLHKYSTNDLPEKWQKISNELYNTHIDNINKLDRQGYKNIDEGRDVDNEYTQTGGEAEQTIPMIRSDGKFKGKIYYIPKSDMHKEDVQELFTPYKGEQK